MRSTASSVPLEGGAPQEVWSAPFELIARLRPGGEFRRAREHAGRRDVGASGTEQEAEVSVTWSVPRDGGRSASRRQRARIPDDQSADRG